MERVAERGNNGVLAWAGGQTPVALLFSPLPGLQLAHWLGQVHSQLEEL